MFDSLLFSWGAGGGRFYWSSAAHFDCSLSSHPRYHSQSHHRWLSSGWLFQDCSQADNFKATTTDRLAQCPLHLWLDRSLLAKHRVSNLITPRSSSQISEVKMAPSNSDVWVGGHKILWVLRGSHVDKCLAIFLCKTVGSCLSLYFLYCNSQ